MVVVYAFTVQGAPFLSRLPCDLAHQMTGMFPYGGRESGTRMVYSVVVGSGGSQVTSGRKFV
jgi:hypothetical protein